MAPATSPGTVSAELRLLLNEVGVPLDQKDRAILGRRLGYVFGLKSESQQDVAFGVDMSQPGVSNRERQIRWALFRARERVAAQKKASSDVSDHLLDARHSITEAAKALGFE